MEITRTYLESLVCERYRTDEHYRIGHQKIIAAAPGTEILGIHTPEMKMTAKAIVKDGSWREIIANYAAHIPLTGHGGLIYEERIIWGYTLDYIKCPLEERIQLIDDYLPAIDSWEICDSFCCNSKWATKEDHEMLWRYIDSLFQSGQEWKIRVSTILSMCHYLNPDSINRTFNTINSIGLKENEPYYVRMGIAWLLATALAKNQDATISFVRHCNLPSDILKLYVRKARESRITHSIPAL